MSDTKYLHHALALAQKRRGFCAPNPSVGAVVVRDGKIIGEGFHFAAGYPHAEVMALQNLSPDDVKNTTLYVTLEPCCHHGRTPPCTDLIIQKKIPRVIYGFKDPNPIVAGKGEAQLKAAGIDCCHLELPEINAFYRSYAHWQQTKYPWVTAKLALSKNGAIADKHKKPVAISGAEANAYTHARRLKSDAILTTAETIVRDDPQFNVRTADGVIAKPIFILDRTLRVPQQAQIFKTAQKITIFYDEKLALQDWQKALPAEFCQWIPCPAADDLSLRGHAQHATAAIQKNSLDRHALRARDDNTLDLRAVMKRIGQQGIHDLWVEVGWRALNALLQAHCIHELILYRSDVCVIENGYAAGETLSFEESVLSSSTKKLGSDTIETFSLQADF